MRANISLGGRDLATVDVTGNRLVEGEHQVYLGDDFSLVAYVTAREARAVASAWSDLAVRLAMVEQDCLVVVS